MAAAENAALGESASSSGSGGGGKTGFVIPKKGEQLFRELDLNSRDWRNDIYPRIKLSYRLQGSDVRINVKSVQMVNNKVLSARYQERKQELLKEGRMEKDLIDNWAYLGCTNEQLQ